jgi:GNAT superfamily N-acetyltransferase
MSITSTRTSTLRIPLQRWRPHRTSPKHELPVGIRARRSRDVGTCSRLLRRAYFEGVFPGHTDDSPRDFLENDDVLDAWVAESEGEIVGHVALRRLEPSATFRWREITGRAPDELLAVVGLFVRPRSRGEGVGADLLDVAAASARAQHRVPVIEVLTTEPTPPPFLHAHGWRLRATDPRRGKRGPLWLHRFEGPRAWTPRSI